MARVICGFPGVGKSEAVKYNPNLVDLDVPGKTDYVETIRELLAEGKDVLLPTWQSLRDELVAAGIHFTLVYPQRDLKANYIARYIRRGSPDKLVETLYQKWDEFITSCETQVGCEHIVLRRSGDYLVDVL